jgi:hypothetical protein
MYKTSYLGAELALRNLSLFCRNHFRVDGGESDCLRRVEIAEKRSFKVSKIEMKRKYTFLKNHQVLIKEL